MRVSFGNKINSVVYNTTGILFNQGELAQLTYQSFYHYKEKINNSKEEVIEVSYPVGYTPTKQPILSRKKYSKEDLIQTYNFLALEQLPLNGIFQLVVLMESMFSDIIREIILKYPKKISEKKTIDAKLVFNSSSIEELYLYIADTVVNDLSYKLPKEFSEEFRKYSNINLLECSSFHKYIELKASRDILIHNKGIANETYARKSNSHARVIVGQKLPLSVQYFLESYEFCLQVCEYLEQKLHEIWPSDEYEQRNILKKKSHNKTLLTK